MTKKLLSVFLVCAVLATALYALAQSDSLQPKWAGDVKEEAGKTTSIEDVSAAVLVELDILKGTDKGLELTRKITRAEAVTLIHRVSGAAIEDIAYETPPFDDMKGHWAQGIVEAYHRYGYVDGTGAGTFTPDRTVTGREFVKMLLAVMGYDGITLENAYDRGVDIGLLQNENTKLPVEENRELTREDAARICCAALTTPLASGETLAQRLVAEQVYTQEQIDHALDTQQTAEKAQTFADSLHAHMPEDKNYMFSPLSIRMALGMLANGAEGKTQEEILRAIQVEKLDEYNQSAQQMIARYSKADILKLSIANSIWMNTDKTPQKFSKSFTNTIQKYYNGTSETVTDRTAVDTINRWVSGATNGKIQTVLQDADFWALLVNAVYFNGKWEKEFDPDNTAKETFTDRSGKASEIDFMRQTDSFRYAEKDGIQMVELPYKNQDENGKSDNDLSVSMYVMMGEERIANPEAVIKSAELQNSNVNLHLPKFNAVFEKDMIDILSELGIQRAFDLHTAEFAPMLDAGNMAVYRVVHKTYIKVDEKETEAAAVTAIEAAGSAAPVEPIEVRFDRPFTYVIRDNTNGEILFMGEFAYPQ